MGVDEVAYHEATVVGRADDHPGAALDYYGSRGETPLRWGGSGAARLGLSGEVTAEAYGAAFGPGGFVDPRRGVRLVATRRPGFELVVSAHKSVAVLGVIDRAEEMHSILDAETAATMDWLDGWVRGLGGRRGRAQQRTATGGLVYARTRHGTSRAGDPSPHDHVLVANLVEMLDGPGGFKGLDSAALRDTVEAATMVGRLHAAARAVALGYRIEPDDGPSGNLRHWRITGVPAVVCEQFSKRSDDITEHLAATGRGGYRARNAAARSTRTTKQRAGVDQLLPVWRGELDAIDWPVGTLTAHLDGERVLTPRLGFAMTSAEVDDLVAEVLDVDGRLLASHKAFTRTHLVAEIAPRLYGRDPAELDRVLARILTSPLLVPLIGTVGAREQTYTTVEVLTAEATIAATVEALADQPGPALNTGQVDAAIGAVEAGTGHSFTAGQRQVVERLCGGGRAAAVVVGVAGAGKTTAIEAAARALEADGYRVLGTSTSGQASRLLGTEAHVEARTFASLLWNLDSGQIRLDSRTVVVIDEAAMATDADLARLLVAAERAHTTVVFVGDPRQLGPVGPGGALTALLARRPDLAVTLAQNVRQSDPAERVALANMRDGSVPDAVAWYANAGRIRVEATRTATLVAMVDAWAQDINTGADTALVAWRRVDVADLNRLARDRWDQLGELHGDDIEVAPGRRYAIGDLIVAVAPNHAAGIVTSQRLTITAIDKTHIEARTTDNRSVRIEGEGLDADHLDHGYALTIHRSQGATYHRTHVLAAGGGRELAYVALSRARHHTTIHTTADNLDQAIDDLQTDWGIDRHQRWITDTTTQTGHTPEHATDQAAPPPPPRPEMDLPEQIDAARQRLAVLRNDYQNLHAGTGRWHNTEQGNAATDLRAARDQLATTRQQAASPTTSRRDRRTATKAIPALETRLDHAEKHWHDIGEPIAEQLEHLIATTSHTIDQLDSDIWIQRLDHLQHQTPEHATDQALDFGL